MSKRILPLLLAIAGALTATPFAQQVPPAPAAKAAPTPAPPAADPFVRNPAAKAAAPVAKEKPEPPPFNILITLETWSLSQADFAALLDGPADGEAPFARLEALAKAGQASLAGLVAVATKSGQRAVVEVVDEVRYASEFDPAQRNGEVAFPVSWETRNTGQTFEIEPNASPDGQTIDLNLVPQNVRLLRFQDWKPEAAAAAVGQPQFQSEKVTTSLTVRSGRAAFLSTGTPTAEVAPEGGPHKVSIRVIRAAVQPAIPASKAAEDPGDARIESLVDPMKREAAQHILADTRDSAQSYSAVRELVEKGEAQLEVVSAFVSRFGQRGVNEELAEFRYPTKTNSPAYNSPTGQAETRQPASFTAFETRNTGVSLEIEPSLDPSGRFVDINVVPQIVRFSGFLRMEGVSSAYPPSPLFTTRKVTTSVSSGAGVPALLGTLSQPQDTGANGRGDDGRTSLAYIRVTPVHP